MQFSAFSTYLEKLEQTSSRLELIDILSELFGITDKEEVDKIIYLMQGRVAPFFAPVELGISEKTVASSLARAFEKDRDFVLSEYGRIGDMGVVAESLRKQKKNGEKKYTVKEVFDVLTKIAETKGDGTVEKRTTLFSDLVEELDSTSVKHIVRVALGNTRLGIGDPTVLDGLALSKLGDKKQRKLLEKAYNETSDLGLIGKTLFEGGLEAVSKLKVTVGRPIRSELCERLPNPVKVFEKMDPDGNGVHGTPKYDGFRVQIHKNGDEVTMYSRNLEDMTHMFPEIIEGTRKQVKAKTAILDSEALAYNPVSDEFLPFQETTKRRRKHNIDEVAKELPLRAFVFDMLYVDGASLIDKPLLERMKILKQTVGTGDVLIPAPGEVLKKPGELQTLLDDSITKGLEGVVVKRVDSPYEAGGRNFNWVKLKRHSSGELSDTIDCVILGYIFGKGKRAEFGAGALLCGVYDKAADTFVTVTKLGTGLTDEEWRSIKERTRGLESEKKPARINSSITPSVWVKPEIVIEVLADEITRSPLHTAGMEEKTDEKPLGYALRFPRLIKFRDKDKQAEDATTVLELTQMFEEQGKKK